LVTLNINNINKVSNLNNLVSVTHMIIKYG